MNFNRTIKQQKKNDDGDGGGGGGGRSAEVVRCDTFLPQVELTILLVEPDHSTRHIISALLRKCSYRGRGSSSIYQVTVVVVVIVLIGNFSFVQLLRFLTD